MSANSNQTTLGRNNSESDTHTTGAPCAHHLLYVKLGFELDSTRHTEVQSLDPAFDKTVSRIAAENTSMNKGPLNIYRSKWQFESCIG